MEKYPFVTIAIVTKNEEKHIRDCLESIVQLDYPKDRYEIIVIDGNSTDMTREIANEYPVKVFVDGGTLASSRNMALQKATGEYIASTDADCVVNKNWLKSLVYNITNAPDDVIAVGGPNLIFNHDPPVAKVIGYMQTTYMASGGAPQSHGIKEKKFVLGIPNCNVLYKKDALIKEGGYDISFNVGEDAEITYRLRKKGYKYLYDPSIPVLHHRPSSIRKFLRKMYVYGISMAQVTLKFKSNVRWYAFIPTLMIFSLLLAIPLMIIMPVTTYIYLFCFALYIALLILSFTKVYRFYPNINSLLVFLLIPVQHLIYGIGFVEGILKTMLRRERAR